MRGDTSRINYNLKDDDDPASTEICGYNILKTARIINLIVGTLLSVSCGFSIFNIFGSSGLFGNLGRFFLNFYMCVFGLIIMASSFGMPCIKRNFLFLLTGIGKGLFNIFVGTLLFTNGDSLSYLIGWAIIAAGCVFLYLSMAKNMSDEDLERALSVYAEKNKTAVKETGKKIATDKKTKEVIAKVANENKEHIANAAYNNREFLADAYIESQNRKPNKGY